MDAKVCESINEEEILYWEGDPIDEDIHCPKCGTIGANLPRFYVRYCSYCGQRLHFKESEEER